MAKLKLTIACDKYDYLQALRDWQVEAEGIDLNLITVENSCHFERSEKSFRKSNLTSKGEE